MFLYTDKIVFPGLNGVLPKYDSSWREICRGIAHLTGGVDRFGAAIIFFPYNSSVLDTNKNDYLNVVEYLTAVTK